ncbi:MAG: 3-dehydroquinate synthase II [Promethearchaeota archaeon]
MKTIIVKVSGRDPDFEEVVQAAVNKGIRSFYCEDAEGVDRLSKLDKVDVYTPEGAGARGNHVFLEDPSPDDWKDWAEGLPAGTDAGAHMTLSNKEDERRVVELAARGASFVLVKATDWKVIPVENLISRMHEMDCELVVEVNTPAEAELMFFTLEHGVDGVMLAPRDINDIVEVARVVTRTPKIELTGGTVVEVQEIPKSDRVCVDTTSLLRPGEGMLVGNTARGFTLVHAEVFETEFVASRPFRVNAGDVSAYILVPGEDPNDPTQFRTQYLSEIGAGSRVVVCDVGGNCRVVSVGRAKIETRPMVLLKLVAETPDPDRPGESLEVPINTILQNAETIRVVRADGEPLSVSKVKVGDEILVKIGPGATHFGTTIKETILEK